MEKVNKTKPKSEKEINERIEKMKSIGITEKITVDDYKSVFF